MASRVLIHLLLAVVLFHVTAAYNYCKDYVSSSGVYKPYTSCFYGQTCCGTCDNRYCCSNPFNVLSEEDQVVCTIKNIGNAGIGLVVLGIAVIIILILTCCCCCECCCLYKKFRKPRWATSTTTLDTQCLVQQPAVQQPAIQGGQYPAYQPMPTQPPYGGQPYPAQPYAQGPPPQYHTVAGPGYPSSQAAYPPTQAGFAPMPQPTDISKQPAYNPAYM